MMYLKDMDEETGVRAKTTTSLAADVIRAFVDAIVKGLIRGERVHVEHLGVFSLRRTRAHVRSLFGAGRKRLPATTRVHFRPSRLLKRMIKEVHDVRE